VISLEDLNVKGMVKNGRLSKHISDSRWYEFRRQLEYKALWYDREIRYTPRFSASSKTCNICGFFNPELTLSQRKWKCSNCGTIHDRDINAAINIRGWDTPEITPVETPLAVEQVPKLLVYESCVGEAGNSRDARDFNPVSISHLNGR